MATTSLTDASTTVVQLTPEGKLEAEGSTGTPMTVNDFLLRQSQQVSASQSIFDQKKELMRQIQSGKTQAHQTTRGVLPQAPKVPVPYSHSSGVVVGGEGEEVMNGGGEDGETLVLRMAQRTMMERQRMLAAIRQAKLSEAGMQTIKEMEMAGVGRTHLLWVIGAAIGAAGLWFGGRWLLKWIQPWLEPLSSSSSSSSSSPGESTSPQPLDLLEGTAPIS